jgi:transposase
MFMNYNIGMYIRRVTRKNKDGSRVSYIQLAHNVWDPKAKYAKAKVIYSFGREDDLDMAVLERLAQSINRFLTPEEALKSKQKIGDTAEFLFRSVKQLGGIWLFDQLWEKLGMDTILEEIFKERKHEINLERAIFAMVANRALAPSSKLGMEEWISEDVYLPGLPSVHCHQLYRAMDELLDAQSLLEDRVFDNVSNLFNLEVDLLYFDTTSSYFEVAPNETPEDDDFRLQGYSKDKRPDLVQTVIGLAVTREGIPIKVWSWPGNTMDMNVIEEVKKDLMGWRLGRIIHVMDRGFSSEENLRILQRGAGHYIIGERMRAGKKDVEAALSKRGRFHTIRENLLVKESIVGDGEARKRYVIAYNPEEAERDRRQRKEIICAVEEQLENLKQLPNEAHHKRACALRAHKVYGKYIRQLKDGTLKLNKQAIRDEEKYDGKYLIRTSDDTLSLEDIALGYKQLLQVESAFRTLKSTLNIRPMYHRLERRIRAHIIINWLALLLVRLIENETGSSWDSVRREVQRLQVGHFTTKDGDLYRTTTPTAKQKEIFNKVGVNLPPEILEIKPKS